MQLVLVQPGVLLLSFEYKPLSLPRVLEINDFDVTTLSPREIKELLHRHYDEEEGVKIVVARPVSTEDTDNEGNMDTVIERYKKLNSSLSVQLESQNAEVDHWRQECNR